MCILTVGDFTSRAQAVGVTFSTKVSHNARSRCELGLPFRIALVGLSLANYKAEDRGSRFIGKDRIRSLL